MKRFAWHSVIAVVGVLSACAAEEPTSGSSEHEDEAIENRGESLKINPCALVRCRAGTQCEVHDGRAVCVPVEPAPECRSDKECRLFSNYCDGCACLALSSSEPDPVCKGTIVACFVDPCRGDQAQCIQGQCVLGGSASF
jgi:hypothetical protein